MNPWKEAFKLERRAFEDLVNQKLIDNVIDFDQAFVLMTRYKLANKQISKKDVEDVFGK